MFFFDNTEMYNLKILRIFHLYNIELHFDKHFIHAINAYEWGRYDN